MATTSPPSPGGDATLEASPLLASQNSSRLSGLGRVLLRAARIFRRDNPWHMIREPSMMDIEFVVDQERHCFGSKPVMLLTILWSLAIVGVLVGVLIVNLDEAPLMSLRLWITGYALEHIFHMIAMLIAYRRRHSPAEAVLDEEEGGSARSSSSNSPREVREAADDEQGEEEDSLRVEHLLFANSIFTFIWWIIGIYWVSAGGQELTRDAPQVYWLCIFFLALDVFYVVFCVALACIAVCCCLPCIGAILRAVTGQEAVFEEDICQLPKYKFGKIGDPEKLDETSRPFGGNMTLCDTDSPVERALSAEDAECHICLAHYEDGAELRELPCSHHFHCSCIDKWLYINAICPLCKYNIIKKQ